MLRFPPPCLPALLVAAALLAACSGGGDATPRATEVPAATPSPAAAPGQPVLRAYKVPAGSHPHDVAPAADGGVWYTAQASGKLGWLDPETGDVREIPLGPGSSP